MVTDHRTLESWVVEYVETASGPTVRRARWYEVFSEFNLTVEYLPGHTNVPADCISRWAYPASSDRQDVFIHGSAKDSATATKLLAAEHTLEALSTNMVDWSPPPETYRLCPQVLLQSLDKWGILQELIQVDLFASLSNKMHPLFIDKDLDAFTFH